MRARFCSRLVMFFLLLCGGYRSSALIISPTYIDAEEYVWDDTRKDIIQQAIDNWESSVLNVESFNVEFTFASAGNEGYLGQWSGSLSLFQGTDVFPWTDGVEHTITFNVDLMDSISFDTAEPQSSKYDALSITRHEIGHAMGFVPDFYYNDIQGENETDKWTSRIDDFHVFDPGGLNVEMDSDSAHIEFSGDLMAPSITNGERKSISQTNLDMLALAYGYEVIPEPSVLMLIALALPFLMYKKLMR